MKGTIRIGFPSSLASYTLPTTISAFREHYPQVKFQLKQGSYNKLIEGVINGDFDMALIGPVPKQEMKVLGTTLFTDNIVALLPTTHPLANQSSIKLGQLRDDSFVLWPKGFILRDIIVDACGQLGFQPKVSFEGEDIDSIKGLVSAGLGITLIPEITLVDGFPRSTVKIPIIEPAVTRTVGVIISRERKMLPTVRLVKRFLFQIGSIPDVKSPTIFSWALYYAFCSKSFTISMTVFVALIILSTDINSYFPWKFSPPVKIFGVGSPI